MQKRFLSIQMVEIIAISTIIMPAFKTQVATISKEDK
jgi:hypothetical protein